MRIVVILCIVNALVLGRLRWKLAGVRGMLPLGGRVKSATCSVACLTGVFKTVRRGRSIRLVSHRKVLSRCTACGFVPAVPQMLSFTAVSVDALRDTLAGRWSALLCGVLLHKTSQCGGCQRLWTVA